ncbi:cell division ATP-binding protein FtsE [Rhizosaccharibacter radicis]|uniref:ATP-binding cassette domain-containing protein n=1 Tax=Rhizosaccharibacter radicis TaxID=2782605 RepID=A0ABT1VX85_9PROT|nr:ATP-binding cassette domain-containing protein [Acetobacteraceae bacterium KSS12]
MIRLDDVGLRYERARGQPRDGARAGGRGHGGGMRDGQTRGSPDEVLRDIALDIPAGAFRWVLGPSGAGKSSLLRLLHLSVLPTRGQMELMGIPIHRARRAVLARLRRRIGVVFQDLRLLPELSAFDNVALRLRLDGLPEARIEREVGEMLRWVGLGAKLDVRPRQLSGGEQQRVAIARAVVHRPPLLLADEPTAALDDRQAVRLIELFRELNQLGSTVLVATHNDGLIRRFPAPALRMDRGTLRSDG